MSGYNVHAGSTNLWSAIGEWRHSEFILDSDECADRHDITCSGRGLNTDYMTWILISFALISCGCNYQSSLAECLLTTQEVRKRVKEQDVLTIGFKSH